MWPKVRVKPLFHKADSGDPPVHFGRRPLRIAALANRHGCLLQKGAGVGTGRLGYLDLNFRLFGDFQRIVDFNTQVLDGTF